MTSIYMHLSGGVNMRHEEMTSSFVQYDVGNLVLMLNSYLLVCSPLILSMAVCCVEVLYHYMS